MKKLYSLLTVAIASVAFGQTPIITAVADGDCTYGTPKLVEIYAQGTVDFSQFSMEKQTNANTTWGSTTDLSSFGIVTDSFVYVYNDGSQDNFSTQFPSATTTLDSGVVNINGDDRVRIIKTSDSSVIDTFGEEGVDGSGEVWEYKDGFAKRNNNSAPSPTFDPSQWSFNNGGLEDKCGSFEAAMGGIGTFTTNTLGTLDLELTKSTSFIENTIVEQELNFTTKSDVKVFDMNGRVVKYAQVSKNKSLDMSDLTKGMYIVTGLVNGQKVSEKIIKK